MILVSAYILYYLSFAELQLQKMIGIQVELLEIFWVDLVVFYFSSLL